MGQIAYVNYEGGRWTVSFDGSLLAYRDREEAVEEARGQLRKAGGGTVYLGSGPGSKGDSIRVWATERSPAPPLPAVPPTPPPSPPPVRAPAPVASPRPPETSGIRAGVVALRDGYLQAEKKIRAFADPIERDLGLGTLRLEAIDILLRLRSSVPPPSTQDLQPLAEMAEGLSGGKLSENAVKGVDAAGRKVLRDVGHSLIGLKLVGSLSFLFGLLLAYADFSVELGGNFAKAVLAGGTAVVLLGKILTQGGPIAEEAFTSTTRWASNLGTPTEAAMAKPREAEQKLLAVFSVVPASRRKPLAARARLRAELTVFGFWSGIAFGVGGFLLGAYGVISRLG